MPRGVRTGMAPVGAGQDPSSQSGAAVLEHNRLRAAEMYLLGRSFREIGAALGVSHVTALRYLEDVRAEWRERRLLTMDAIKDETLARIDRLERAAWEAWERSCAPTTVHRKEMAPPALRRDQGRGRPGQPAPAVNPAPIPPAVMREVIETRTSAGNPAFLQQVAWCIDERCKVLGVLKEVGGATAVTLNWATMAAGYTTAALPDPVGDALAAAEARARDDAARLPPRETTAEVQR